jgi:hypothetical protein
MPESPAAAVPAEPSALTATAELEILKAAVREYLRHPSLDGHPDRQIKRRQLAALSNYELPKGF